MMRAAASALSRNCGRGGGGSASPGARAPGARRRRAPYRWRATARRRARGPAGRPRERRRRRGETYRRGQRALVRLRGGRRSRNGARGKRTGGAPLSSAAVLERATGGGAPGSSAEATAAAARRSGGGRPDARTAPPLSLPPPRRRRAASGCTPSPRPGSPAAPGRRRRAHRRGADIESALAEARLFKTAIARWFARVLALPQARSTVRLSTPWDSARWLSGRVFARLSGSLRCCRLAYARPQQSFKLPPPAIARGGTGGLGILVRIPWTPRAARKSRTAARAPKIAICRRVGRSGHFGAARRAALP